MNGVEAAASLFGSEEPASDPFAALGEPQSSHEDPFPEIGASYSPHSGATAQHSNPISVDNRATSPAFHEYSQQGPHSQISSYPTGSYAPELGGGTSQQGRYSESAYNIPEPTFTEHISHQNDATSTSGIQDPYAPPSDLMTASNASQSVYSDYAPAQPGPGYNTLADYSNPSYSYPSSSQPSGSQYNPSYPVSSQTSYLQQNVDSKSSVPLSVPPPAPAPIEPINRPKISNAYDPPFPTLTKSRRSAAPRTGLSQTHSGYNPYQTHLPPPPAAETSAPPPPPQAPQVQPTEWGHSESNYNSMSHGEAAISGFGGPPPAHPKLVEGFHGRSNSYNRAFDVDPPVAASSKHVEPHVPDYATPVPPAATQARDSYCALPSPTKTRSQASSPLAHPPILADTRSSSPFKPLSPPSPLLGHTFAYGRSTPPTQVTMGPIDSNRFVPEPLRDSFSTPSFPQNIEQTVETSPFESGSANGFHDQQTDSNDMFSAADEATASSPTFVSGPSYDPYAPKSYVNGSYMERTSSPSSIRSWTGTPAKSHPSVNQHSPPRADILRSRSMSNGPTVSPRSTSARDPYAPSQHPRRQKSETDYGIYGYHHGREHTQNYPSSLIVDHPPVQETLVKPFQTPYAPSPSLLGANDPLGRRAARVPVFSFGFGGKVATCFHGADSLNTGFDVALSSRNSTGVHIRVLKQLIPQSALDTSTIAFPGPLFSDPGSLTSLVRTGPTSQTKTKKAQVLKYLGERTDEIALGLRYLNSDSIERRRAEGKLVLIKLLKVMIEHDGRLTGTPQLDMAVRVALLPRLAGSADINGTLGTAFPTPADPQGSIVDLSPAPYPVLSGAPTLQETPISVITLRPSFLDKIQSFLLRGERREAYLYALDQKLWAHAMVIASSIDKEAWKEVVNDFLKNELRPKDLAANTDKLTNGQECLRVAYSLFSGQGAVAVQELVPQTALSHTGRLQPQVASQMTPRTSNFAVPSVTAPIPVEAISQWAETVAMILSSPLPQETLAALTSLGDQLMANQLPEAAHVCYLLAPQTSPMGGLGNPSARVVLVGSQSPQILPNFAKDPDPFIFSEVVEFALSLAAPTRGQDPYQGIPHLQPYRFIRAMALAEIGDIQLASRYCEAITAAVGRSSPYFTPALLDHLKGFSDRIIGVTQVDKSGSWMGAKLSKPSLDTIGGWLEGRFTKLVTGDAETPTAGDDDGRAEDRSFSGPFSHYSTISSATPSARSSPQPSLVNVLPPARSGSAMASSAYYPPIDRASSAMDYTKPKVPPSPRVSSANPATTAFAYSTSFGQSLSNLGTPNVYNAGVDLITPRPAEHGDDNTKQDGSWWGSSAYDETSNTQTPTASTFLRVDGNSLPSSNGFISLMDNDPYSPAPPSSAHAASEASPALDDEDLGFGNSKREGPKDTKAEHEGNSPSQTPHAEPKKSETPESAPAPSGSWISRWWKRSDSATPGPTKASLGEESAFFYDKDLKRWVNKKAGSSEPSKPTPAPPPSRAHTASPGMSGVRHLGTSSDTRPPPARPASAIDLSTSPPSKTVMRMRSNLVPLPESAPSSPTGSRSSPGPPPGRPKSQASKRNIRSRYVDVFQQGASA